MVSIVTLKRTIAVMVLMPALIIGECVLLFHSPQLLPGLAGRIACAVSLSVLAFYQSVMSWEARRRREDDEAVRQVVEAARSLGVELPKDRAIFPVFHLGHVKPQSETIQRP